jgi:DNA-directed RNA polymerase subunit E'/Rpb7
MELYLNKPYYDVEQDERILLKPQQMNSDILLNLKINTKEKIEGRCNKYGYIEKVYKILQYNDGLLESENLSGGAVYRVKYHCRMYSPLENTSIVGEIILLNPELIIVINGPIRMFIPRDSINNDAFDMNRSFMIKKTKESLQLNQKVVVTIKEKKINPGDKNIKCIGYLQDVASEKQIKEYYDDEAEESTSNNFIL